MSKQTSLKADTYQRITDKIVADLERGVRPWFQPWNAAHLAGRITRPLRHNGEPYSGINVIMLWMTAVEHGYANPHWMTFRQAKEFGASVRKGERGTLVVYANTLVKTERDDAGNEEERTIPFLKGYTVFNVEQIDGLPERYNIVPEPRIAPFLKLDHAERFFDRTGAETRHGGNRAFYSVTDDYIQLPPFETFRDAEAYYATRGHETIHWTRHKSRLDRDFGRKRFGDEGYAMEELVAELGSAFLSADLALAPDVRDDHAAYIDSWLRVLRNDKRAIFTAAAHAQRAAEYLHQIQLGHHATETAA